MKARAILMTLLFLTALTAAARAEFFCEVLEAEGDANVYSGASSIRKSVQKGDLLKAGDTLEVGRESQIDLAYDRDWKNIVRIEAGSSVKLVSIVPGSVHLRKGAVYAKLDSLPKDSTFTVETPSAIACVRGTEYRTAYAEEGGTEIFNLSKSEVYVFSLQASGEEDQVGAEILKQYQKTALKVGEKPREPAAMTVADMGIHTPMREEIVKRVSENVQRGRVGKIHTVDQVREFFKERDTHNIDGFNTQGPMVSTGQIAAAQKQDFEKQLLRSDRLIRAMDVVYENFVPVDEREDRPGAQPKPGGVEERDVLSSAEFGRDYGERKEPSQELNRVEKRETAPPRPAEKRDPPKKMEARLADDEKIFKVLRPEKRAPAPNAQPSKPDEPQPAKKGDGKSPKKSPDNGPSAPPPRR